MKENIKNIKVIKKSADIYSCTTENAEKKEKHMSNFNLNDFFAAFNSLKARGTASIKSTTSSSSKSCGSCSKSESYTMPERFQCKDEEVKLDCESQSGWHCRHTKKPTVEPEPSCTCRPEPQPQPTCRPRPTCNPQPQPSCHCKPEPQPQPSCQCKPDMPKPTVQTGFFNTGIIDGPGNDVYDAQGNDIYDGNGNDIYAMGNRGIIDTDGNDIYAKNYTVNTFNTMNNFEIKPDPAPTQPTVPTKPTTPTDPTTPTTPTVDPPDPGKPDTVDLMPLRSLLTGLEARTRDGILSDSELTAAMSNPAKADMDGDPSNISDEEMAIFNKIKEFNEDKNLISSIIKGDYSNIDADTLADLGALSDQIKALTKY